MLHTYKRIGYRDLNGYTNSMFKHLHRATKTIFVILIDVGYNQYKSTKTSKKGMVNICIVLHIGRKIVPFNSNTFVIYSRFNDSIASTFAFYVVRCVSPFDHRSHGNVISSEN